MLSIFKKHEAESHLLEDFEYYEKREKLMQENRAHQLQHHHLPQQQIQMEMVDPCSVGTDGELIAKSFARAVRVEDNNNINNIKSADVDDSVSTALSKPEDFDLAAPK